VRPALDRPDPAGPRRAPGGGATVAFAEFELSINESTTRFGAGPPEVLVHAKFQQGDAAPERVAAVLAHEGGHVADGRPPSAADELRARQSELEACGRLFGAGVQPNRGCADAASLLARRRRRHRAAEGGWLPMNLTLDWPVGRAGVTVVSPSGTETAFLGGVTGGDEFEVASVTKLMTSLAALAAVSSGRLGLDQPVPEAVRAGAGGRHVRHLLAHAGGFPSSPRAGPARPASAASTPTSASGCWPTPSPTPLG
jgi:hypothetical protein